jgi:hypothetical protein
MEEVAIYNYALSSAQVQAHYAGASNRAPVFASNPLARSTANAGQVYSDTIAGSATDPNGDAITYAKVSGAGWLTVAGNGALSGTPANVNANTNTFVVSARDAGGLSNTVTLYIYVNGAPSFTSTPFNGPSVVAGQTYSGSIATNAADPNPTDTLTFSKLTGPSWLLVAGNGSYFGTPLSADVGTNSFVLSVTDQAGLSGTATMLVNVLPAPGITESISWQGANLFLNWSGGIAPYQVQTTATLENPNWQTVASGLSSPGFLLTPTNSAGFYRILGQ